MTEGSERRYTLYCHINKSNGKMYFGITKNTISQRYHGSHGYVGCPIFYNAIKKYGWDNFIHLALYEHFTRQEAELAEIIFIHTFDTTNPERGYNIQSGGQSTGEVSEEGHRRLVEAASGANAADAKPIVVFDLQGNKIEEFVTIEETKKKYKSTIIWKNADRYSHAINGFFFRFKSVVGDADKMDEDDLANSPLSTPKKYEVSPKARPVAVFDRVTGNRITTIPSVKNILDYEADNSKMWKRKYALSDKYVFKFADEVEGIDVLDLSFLDIPINCGQKEVNQYNVSGKLIATYSSLREASDVTGISYKSMSQCASHKIKSSGGYVWRYVDDPVQFEKPKTCSESRKANGSYKYKPVDQIDLETGEVIKTFNSLTEAAKELKVSRQNIFAVANHIKNSVSAAGYGWRYHIQDAKGVG